MLVTAIDGVLVADRDARISGLRAVLLSQPGDVRPDAVDTRRDEAPPALLVRVLLPSSS
jgi:hypothetical protein